MDIEKFDLELQEKIHKYELEHIPVFDEHRTWKKIESGSNGKTWFRLLAASIIVILGLTLLFHQLDHPAEIVMAKKYKQAIKKRFFAELQTPFKFNKQLPNARKTDVMQQPIPSLNTVKVADNTPVTTSLVSVPDSMQTRPEPAAILTLAVKAEPAKLLVENPEVLSEIKVTFKRGSPVIDASVENRIALKKFNLRIFENQIYDTSSYASGAEVKADKKFRIKF